MTNVSLIETNTYKEVLTKLPTRAIQQLAIEMAAGLISRLRFLKGEVDILEKRITRFKLPLFPIIEEKVTEYLQAGVNLTVIRKEEGIDFNKIPETGEYIRISTSIPIGDSKYKAKDYSFDPVDYKIGFDKDGKAITINNIPISEFHKSDVIFFPPNCENESLTLCRLLEKGAPKYVNNMFNLRSISNALEISTERQGRVSLAFDMEKLGVSSFIERLKDTKQGITYFNNEIKGIIIAGLLRSKVIKRIGRQSSFNGSIALSLSDEGWNIETLNPIYEYRYDGKLVLSQRVLATNADGSNSIRSIRAENIYLLDGVRDIESLKGLLKSLEVGVITTLMIQTIALLKSKRILRLGDYI